MLRIFQSTSVYNQMAAGEQLLKGNSEFYKSAAADFC